MHYTISHNGGEGWILKTVLPTQCCCLLKFMNWERISTNASSLYRFQNIFFAGPKINIHFVPVLNILCHTKRWFTFSKSGFVPAQNFWKGTKCNYYTFGLAQNIWNGTKHFWTCRRTRHKVVPWSYEWLLNCRCANIKLFPCQIRYISMRPFAFD